METVVSDAGQLRKQLTITIPQAEVAARRNQMLERYSGQVRMKGFRPGKKPPRSVIEKRLGGSLDEEVFQSLVNEGLDKGIKDHQLKPIGQMTTDNSSKEGDITHVVSFDVMPTIELPAAADVPLTLGDTSVSDEELAKELDDLARRAGSYSDLDAEASLGKDDIVTLCGSITQGDETLRDMQDLQHLVGGYPLLGLEPEQVIEKVSALHVGEVLSFDTTLPESFTPAEHAGKEAHVALTIQSARRMIPAELTDEFVKRFGMDSVDSLKERVKQGIEGRKTDEVHNAYSEAVLDHLVSACAFDLPEKLHTEILNQQLEQARSAHKEGDEPIDEAAITATVEKDLRRQLIIENIADQRKVTVSEQDLNQQISMAAYQSGRKPEDIAKQLKESGRINQVAAEIRSAKAVSLFVEEVVSAHSPKSEQKDGE